MRGGKKWKEKKEKKKITHSTNLLSVWQCKQESWQNSQGKKGTARQLVRWNRGGKIVQDYFNIQLKLVTFWTVVLEWVCKHKFLPSEGELNWHWLSNSETVCGLCRHDVKSSLSKQHIGALIVLSPKYILVTFRDALRFPGLEIQQEQKASFYTKFIQCTEAWGSAVFGTLSVTKKNINDSTPLLNQKNYWSWQMKKLSHFSISKARW